MADSSDEAQRSRYRDECVQAAMLSGLYYGGIGIALGISATLAANAMWPRFRVLNASAKTAIAISPGLFAGFAFSEEKLVAGLRAKPI